jgi:Protein of unknown function (DUF3592)
MKSVQIISFVLGIAGRRTETLEPGPMLMALFFVAALAMLGIGIYLTQKRKEWIKHAFSTMGQVVHVNKRYDRQDVQGLHPIYFPVVTFDVNGTQFKIEADKGINNVIEIGQSMTVRYNPTNPSESALNDVQVPVANPMIFYVVGTLLCAVSGLLLL